MDGMGWVSWLQELPALCLCWVLGLAASSPRHLRLTEVRFIDIIQKELLAVRNVAVVCNTAYMRFPFGNRPGLSDRSSL
jgi:hypothetical protein